MATTFYMINGDFVFSEYGRNCKDIGCRSNEICVMVEDKCTYDSRDNCGHYPTCTRAGGDGKLTLNIILFKINDFFDNSMLNCN